MQNKHSPRSTVVKLRTTTLCGLIIGQEGEYEVAESNSAFRTTEEK